MTTLPATIENDIQIDDLPDDARMMADIIGLDAVISLSRHFGGEALYIAKLETITRQARNRAILAAFNGANISELMREYNLSANAVREIVRPVRSQRPAPRETQLSLF